MNLVIDIGNSRTKTAIFSERKLVETSVFDELTCDHLTDFVTRYPGIDQVILSTVSTASQDVLTFLKTKFPCFLELNHQTPVPIEINYLTPGTLGLDRLAAAIGARILFPGHDLLVIDAGTAVTFDLVERNGTFAGGNISPGLRSRFRALHEFTGKLPLVDETGACPVIGKSTEEAIRSGVVNGMILEIDGMIDLLKKKRPELQPVLTGGDAQFFERRLKSTIFVKFEITLIGLNRILEYNVEKQ
ncbi:MAG TPA: type III pantothenate kinase [Prolixibacteraceae bacterium]|nr:type III pantothenate kinase [Prolixibacteraceae bacterium]